MSNIVRFTHLENPTEGYRRSMYANGAALLQTQTGEPWFTWGEIPLMMQHPTIRFGRKLIRTPFSTVKLDEKKLIVPKNPLGVAFIKDCFQKFWVRGVPRVVDHHTTWGRGVLGIDYRWDQQRRIVRIKKVRKIEPFDAQPLVWETGPNRGQFAGINLRSGNRDTPLVHVKPPFVFYFAGNQELDQYCDLPRIVGAVTPWKEQMMPGGAAASVRLFYWTRAVGITEVRYPHGKPLVLHNGSVIDAQDAARYMGERTMNGMVVTLPNDKHPTMEGEYEWSMTQRPAQSDTAGVLDYKKSLRTDMLEGMEIPEEIINKESGAFSGRSLPMESWYGGADETARMIWDEFREQHLDRLMWMNFKVREYDCPLTSLLEEFRAQEDKSGAGGPKDSPPTDPQRADKKPEPTTPEPKKPQALDLSSIPSGGESKYDKKTKELHCAIALGMVEAHLRKRMGADEDGDADDVSRWLPELATDDGEAAQALGAKMLGWIRAGESSGPKRSGTPRWKDETTGKYRYQQSKPGEHAERRRQAGQNAARGHEIIDRVTFGTHHPAELHELDRHLADMTVPQLRQARAKLRASFGNAKRRDQMVAALRQHIQQRLIPANETQPAPPPVAPPQRPNAEAHDRLAALPNVPGRDQHFSGNYGPEVSMSSIGFAGRGRGFAANAGRDPDKLVTMTLDPSQVRFTQPTVTRSLLSAKIDNPSVAGGLDRGPVLVVKDGDEYHLQGGNHRAAAEVLRTGRFTAQVVETAGRDRGGNQLFRRPGEATPPPPPPAVPPPPPATPRTPMLPGAESLLSATTHNQLQSVARGTLSPETVRDQLAQRLVSLGNPDVNRRLGEAYGVDNLMTHPPVWQARLLAQHVVSHAAGRDVGPSVVQLQEPSQQRARPTLPPPPPPPPPATQHPFDPIPPSPTEPPRPPIPMHTPRQIKWESEATKAAAKAIIGDGYNENDLHSLVSSDTIPGGGVTHVRHGYNSLTINQMGRNGVTIQRTLRRDSDGQLSLKNDLFFINREDRPGQNADVPRGADMLSRQIDAARRLGVKMIKTDACRGSTMNGYITWPKLGYDGPLPPDKLRALPAALKTGMAGNTNIQSLLAQPGGADWWQQHGDSITLSFDPHPDSPNSRYLANYLARPDRGSRNRVR